MLRYVALILLILLLALQVKLWTGEGGMREVWRLQQRVSEQKAGERQAQDSATRRCRPKCEDLKYGDEAVEERARTELGLIKPGETFYQVVEPTNAAAQEPNDDGGH